jgi:hypothetical protein
MELGSGTDQKNDLRQFLQEFLYQKDQRRNAHSTRNYKGASLVLYRIKTVPKRANTVHVLTRTFAGQHLRASSSRSVQHLYFSGLSKDTMYTERSAKERIKGVLNSHMEELTGTRDLCHISAYEP